MHWNYRVIEFVEPGTDKPWRAIHEVHYDDEGRPELYSEDPAIVMVDSDEEPGGMAQILDWMRAALDKPVLVEKDFKRD